VHETKRAFCEIILLETMDLKEKIFTVSEYIEVLNVYLKREEIRVIGEVSQMKRAVSGHVYFTVKDQNGEAVLDAIVWKGNYARCGVDLEVGMEVVLTGRPQIYPPTGRFSFVADTVELHGEGALKKAYDKLKAKLDKEGVFSPDRKRDIPELPSRVGVITSREGAVIHDFINNLGRFGFSVLLVDSRVEGQQATQSLLEALETLKKRDVEVVIMIRGGGSLESLQAFNNETLVRAVVDSPVPVIVGIGHDQDIPLVSLAADHAVSTPTAVAHLLNRSWEEAYQKIRQVPHLLIRVEQELKHIRSDIDAVLKSLLENVSEGISQLKRQLDHAKQVVGLNDPTRQLKLGYSIVRKRGKVIKTVGELGEGDDIETQLGDGNVRSKVEEIQQS